MWETVQDGIYMILLLMMGWTFVSPRRRARIGAALAALWTDLLGPLAYQAVTGDPMPDMPGSACTEPNPTVQEEKPLPSAQERHPNGAVQVSDSDFQPANADEIRMLALALRHNLTTQDKTKTGAIKAGFGVSRGGSTEYRRASELWDITTAALAEPEFWELDAQGRATPKRSRPIKRRVAVAKETT